MAARRTFSSKEGATNPLSDEGLAARKPVAYCRGPERCPSNMVANANLIASAPELYKTLEHVRELLVAYGPRYIDKAVKLADGTLAKANPLHHLPRTRSSTDSDDNG